MELQSAEVSDCGPIQQVRLEFEEGLNLISGPNEAGKSTLMRALWYGLTWRPTSQAEEIRALIPQTGGTPTVELTFESDSAEYVLTKRFAGQQGIVHLRIRGTGSAEDLQGEEAQQRLRNALGFGSPSGRPKLPSHYGFWPVTWVWQGESQMNPAKDLGEAGRKKLASALSEITGEVLAGPGGEKLYEKGEERYLQFYTKSGNKTSRSGAPLPEAEKQLEESEARFEELRARQQEYEQDLRRYAELVEERDRLENEELPRREKEVEELEDKQEEVEEIRSKKEDQDRQIESLTKDIERLEERLERRDELQEKIDELNRQLEEETQAATKKSEALEAAKEKRDRLKGRRSKAKQARNEARSRYKRAKAWLQLLRAEDREEQLEEALEIAKEHQATLNELDGRVSTISVDQVTIERLEELRDEHRDAQTRLETAAAHLRLQALEDLTVTIGGEKIDLDVEGVTERRIDVATTVQIGSSAELEITPGGEDLGDIRQKAAEAEENYEQALYEVGVESLQAARSRMREKERLQNEQERREDLLGQVAPDGVDTLEADLAGAQEEREEAQQTLEETGEEANRPSDISEAKERRDEAEAQLEQANEDLAQAEREVEAHRETASDIERDLEGRQTNQYRTAEQLEETQSELEAHIEEHGDRETLESDFQTSRSEKSDLEQEIDQIEDQLEELDARHIAEDLERARDGLDQVKSERETVRDQLARVEARLERADLHGLHERLEEARQRKQATQAEVDRWSRQARAAKLLYETLDRFRSKARRKQGRPLREETQTLLRHFFRAQDVTVGFGEDFEVQKLSRNTEGTHGFDRLSAGAREQLGILVRLAMARLLTDEEPHPAFLDEPLADTDPARFRAMAGVFRKVAEDVQLIVTTCHRRRYRDLGVEPVFDFEVDPDHE